MIIKRGFIIVFISILISILVISFSSALNCGDFNSSQEDCETYPDDCIWHPAISAGCYGGGSCSMYNNPNSGCDLNAPNGCTSYEHQLGGGEGDSYWTCDGQWSCSNQPNCNYPGCNYYQDQPSSCEGDEIIAFDTKEKCNVAGGIFCTNDNPIIDSTCVLPGTNRTNYCSVVGNAWDDWQIIKIREVTEYNFEGLTIWWPGIKFIAIPELESNSGGGATGGAGIGTGGGDGGDGGAGGVNNFPTEVIEDFSTFNFENLDLTRGDAGEHGGGTHGNGGAAAVDGGDAGAIIRLNVHNLTINGLLSVEGDKGHIGWGGRKVGRDIATGGGGGGGGGSGGWLILDVFELAINPNYEGGTIRAVGGAGGKGGEATCAEDDTENGGQGGGGGGGKGGRIDLKVHKPLITYEDLDAMVNVSRGAGGEKADSVDCIDQTPNAGNAGTDGFLSIFYPDTETYYGVEGCNNGYNDDYDFNEDIELIDMRDPDCWHTPEQTNPVGICPSNFGPVSDFLHLSLEYASALNGFDGCCGDDLGDLYFISTGNKYFCEAIHGVDEDENEILEDWNWWDAEEDAFRIHTIITE